MTDHPVHIDIETFCLLDLKKVGVYRYTEDPSFEILLVCWRHKGVNGEWRVWDQLYPPQEFLYAVEGSGGAVAFNSNFERVCFSSQYAKKIGVPQVLSRRDFWQCAQAQALCSGLPAKLDKAIKAIKPDWQQHHLGHRAMMKLKGPRKPTAKNASTRWTPSFCPADYENLVAYCHQDVDDEVRIWTETRDLSEAEWRLFWLDQEINDRGVRIDQKAVQMAQAAGEAQKRMLNTEAMALTGFKLSQVAAIADYMGQKSLGADRVRELLASPGDLRPDHIRMLQLRQEFAKTSVSKLDAMLRCVCGDGRLHGMFQFAGAAATNRWAGRIVQLQNLVRDGEKDPETAIADIMYGDIDRLGMLYGDVMSLLSRLLRAMLVPEEGNVFQVCDYSAIEAVVLGWLADCKFYMDEFSGEGKMYEAMAATIFNTDKSQIINPSPQRHLGKATILGCGFQMGAERFVRETQEKGSKENETTLVNAHSAYRASVPEIADYEKGLWTLMNTAAMYAVENPGKTVAVKGKIKFGVEGDWLYMVLPSGRPLAYYKPEVRRDPKFNRDGVTYMGLDSYTNQWTRLRTYGGKLTENAVQAIARDLLAHAMMKVDAAGLNIVMHVHDEIIVESPYRTDTSVLEDLMCDVPDWAVDLPVRAEGKIVTRYQK